MANRIVFDRFERAVYCVGDPEAASDESGTPQHNVLFGRLVPENAFPVLWFGLGKNQSSKESIVTDSGHCVRVIGWQCQETKIHCQSLLESHFDSNRVGLHCPSVF